MLARNANKRPSPSKLRQREAALDARASLLDTDTDLSFAETLEIAARGMFFTRHFKGRFLSKNVLLLFALSVPVTIMPWPIKIVIDHVVLNTRLTQSANHYLRSRLFQRIKALPMTTLEDQRIGDSVYRVLYDVPSMNYVFYEISSVEPS